MPNKSQLIIASVAPLRFRLPSSARLPRIEADSGLIPAVTGGGVRRSQPPGQNPATDWLLIYVHLAEGDQRGARRLADLWWNKGGTSANTWGMVAQMYGALDDADRVVECFLRMSERCDNPDPCPGGRDSFMLIESIYPERVRRDPRLLDLAAKARQRQAGT